MSKDVESGLVSDDAEARRRAVAALVNDDAPDREGKLIAALGDTDWRVRKEAANVASEMAEPWDLFGRLVDALCQGENVGLRNAALEVLERLGPRAAQALLSALPRVPETARKFIVAALGFAGAAGVEKLAEISNDPDPNTAQAALEALARAGGRRAEDALLSHLANENPVTRLAALEGLERLEASLAFDRLEPLLRDRMVRRVAVRQLGWSDDPRAVGALFDVLGDTSAATVHEAVSALGRTLDRGGPSAREAGRRARTIDEGTRSRLRSIAALSSDRAQQAATWLLLLARDREVLNVAAELAGDDRMPPVALESLRAWGVDAVEPLLEVSAKLAPRARGAALEMASELAAVERDVAKSTRDALMRSLREALAGREPMSATAAAAAMVTWAEPQDAAELVKCAVRFPEHAARAAGRALEHLALRYSAEVEQAIGTVTLDGAVGAALLPAVAAVGGPLASDRLQATLSADDPRARRAAVMALARLGGERAAELAGFALADEDIDVQTAAVIVLAQLVDGDGTKLGAEQLRVALRAEVEPVVAAAARALGAIGDRTSIPALRELVSEGRAGIAVAALESLRALDDPGLDDLLVEALGQTDEELVKETLRAIATRPDAPRSSARIALALEHAAWDVRKLAAQLLGEIGGADAREALSLRAPRETDHEVMDAIERALGALGGDG